MFRFKKKSLDRFANARRHFNADFKTIGVVKQVFRMNPSSWVVETIEEDVPKFLATKDLGSEFKDKPFTPKLLPLLTIKCNVWWIPRGKSNQVTEYSGPRKLKRLHFDGVLKSKHFQTNIHFSLIDGIFYLSPCHDGLNKALIFFYQH